MSKAPKFEIERLDREDVIRFRGEFPLGALVSLRLDPLDRALLHDVGGDGPPATGADYLLVLEMLFRRYSEQRVTPGKPTTATGAPAPAEPPAARASDDAAPV